MLEPDELLGAARLLVAAGPAQPTDAQLRRAISTAYYALFHAFLRVAAERFVGSGQVAQPAFAILYRGFGHGRMKAVCVAVDVAKLSESLARQLRRPAIHETLRDSASSFVALQAARQRADYDPQADFTLGETLDLIDQAELAMASFSRAPPEERADLLALMLAPMRD